MRNRILHSIIWVVAISIINCSIGIPDIDSHDFGNTTQQALNNWNEFESIYEWVVEEALECHNAVPEQKDKHGNENIVLKKHAPDYIPLIFEKNRISYPANNNITLLHSENTTLKPIAGYITLFSPPPDIVKCFND